MRLKQRPFAGHRWLRGLKIDIPARRSGGYVIARPLPLKYVTIKRIKNRMSRILNSRDTSPKKILKASMPEMMAAIRKKIGMDFTSPFQSICCRLFTTAWLIDHAWIPVVHVQAVRYISKVSCPDRAMTKIEPYVFPFRAGCYSSLPGNAYGSCKL